VNNEINPNSTQKFSCGLTNGRSHGTCSTQTNRFALINTSSTSGTPWTKCRIFTHAAGSASAKNGARRASARSNDRPTDPLLAAPCPAAWRGVASDRVRRVAYLLINRVHHVSRKYSVVKLPRDVLVIKMCLSKLLRTAMLQHCFMSHVSDCFPRMIRGNG